MFCWCPFLSREVPEPLRVLTFQAHGRVLVLFLSGDTVPVSRFTTHWPGVLLETGQD